MRVVWTPEARTDRFEIWAWIAREDPFAAARMDERFGTAVHRLGDHPQLGQDGLVPGTREFIVHESYRLIYEVDSESDRIWILGLVHTHRQWPPLQDERE